MAKSAEVQALLAQMAQMQTVIAEMQTGKKAEKVRARIKSTCQIVNWVDDKGKSHQLLEITGNGAPLRLGVGKCKMIADCLDQVVAHAKS